MAEIAVSDEEFETATASKTKPFVIEGTDKGLYGEAKGRVAGFSGRMVGSNTRMNQLEDSGFDPVNIIDVTKDNLPFIPDFLERFLQSTKYKLYKTNKMNWSTAQLRRETGAVINASEIVWIEETYFPQLGDGSEVQELKRLARTEATNAMLVEAGSAYKGMTLEEARIKALEIEKNRARKILLERAKKNPHLAAEIQKVLKGIK